MLFENKTVKALLSVVLIFCGLWLITANSDLNLISSTINTLMYPFKLSGWAFGENLDEKYDLEKLKEENEKLRKELSERNNQLVDYYDVKQENAQLRKYFNIKEKNNDYDLIPIEVISRDASNDFYDFEIDKGSASGIKVGNPVLTENGLVGWVSDVKLNTSTVITILSPKTKVSVVDPKTKDTGIICGKPLLCDKNLTAMINIASDNKIKVGDIISTTGTSGVYPADIVVGVVEEIKLDEYDTSVYAVIRPYENIINVSDAVVVTGFKADN